VRRAVLRLVPRPPGRPPAGDPARGTWPRSPVPGPIRIGGHFPGQGPDQVMGMVGLGHEPVREGGHLGHVLSAPKSRRRTFGAPLRHKSLRDFRRTSGAPLFPLVRGAPYFSAHLRRGERAKVRRRSPSRGRRATAHPRSLVMIRTPSSSHASPAPSSPTVHDVGRWHS
jgi:hypothetical protein